jgi:hypothetical protein
LVGVVLDDGGAVTLDGIIMKIVSLKKLVQMIVCYFVTDTLALAEW